MIFNLLPWRENLQHKKLCIFLLQFFITLLLTLLLIALIQSKNQFAIRQQQECISRLHSKKPNNNETKEIQKNIANEISIQTQFIKFLSTINTLLPNAVYLTKLEKTDRSLQLFGNAPSHTEILSLLDQFNKKFPKEKLALSETNNSKKNDNEIDFILTYSLSSESGDY